MFEKPEKVSEYTTHALPYLSPRKSYCPNTGNYYGGPDRRIFDPPPPENHMVGFALGGYAQRTMCVYLCRLVHYLPLGTLEIYLGVGGLEELPRRRRGGSERGLLGPGPLFWLATDVG